MGERYTLTTDQDNLTERYNLENVERYTPRYNAAPTQILPVITQGSKGLSFFYWGQIPERAKGKSISTKLIHSESENILQKVSSRNALMTRRCLIPADGYYDWKKVGKKAKIPYRFVFESDRVVSFAGIWEEFEDEKENVFHTFKIITTSANSAVSTMNIRMPLVIPNEKEAVWLDRNSTEEDVSSLFAPYPAEKMTYYSVSPKIEDVTLDSPMLLKPSAPADQFGNYSLFD